MLRLRFLVPLFVFGSILSCSAQLTSDAIAAARAYSGKHSGVGMIVAEAGVIRYEDYYNGHKGKEPLHIYSGTKSFFGVLAVIAEEEGILKLDDLVAETLPEWRDDPRKKLIPIRELLNFTSGLETGFEQIYGRTTADKLLLGVGLKATRERGATFLYGPGNLQVFCEVLRRKL
ncbi:MAG TPA: serine hydrolase, partial [Verrucomicrobiales bacterium]|nr:serine hydrolase [Verrucomicrobiales bacterium]